MRVSWINSTRFPAVTQIESMDQLALLKVLRKHDDESV